MVKNYAFFYYFFEGAKFYGELYGTLKINKYYTESFTAPLCAFVFVFFTNFPLCENRKASRNTNYTIKT